MDGSIMSSRSCSIGRICGIFVASAVVVTGISATVSRASVINYGNFAGSTVDFINVSESATSDPVPLYGAPDGTIDDNLNFDPQLFSSSASGGAADITDGLVNFIVDAKPGKYITSVSFNEFGDYTLAGAGNAATSALVGQSIFVEVTELDGVPLVNPIVIAFNSIFNPSNGDYFLPGEAGLAQPWFGVGTLNIATELLNRQVLGHATQIEITSNNTLATTSQTGTVAYISKKDLNIGIGTDVPEPAMLSALIVGAGLVIRRR